MSDNSDLLKLISLLSDGDFHSGEELGQKLSISRAAIWKRLEGLKELGLSYESVRGKGYRLSPAIVPLSQASVNKALVERGLTNKVEVVGTVGSTNAEVLQQIDTFDSGDIIIAEMQTAGRGRRGKVWLSPYASNINMTMYWKYEHGMKAVDGLSLVVGLAVINALSDYATTARLKWPNDIVHDNKKLAGVLLEISGEPNGVCHIAIGIGINVNVLDSKYFSQVDQAWTSLAKISGESIDRNVLVPKIVANLRDYLKKFECEGFPSFAEQWAQYDALVDQEVIVHLGERMIYGIAKGVTQTGELKVETQMGVETFNGGEVSLRRKL